MKSGGLQLGGFLPNLGVSLVGFTTNRASLLNGGRGTESTIPSETGKRLSDLESPKT